MKNFRRIAVFFAVIMVVAGMLLAMSSCGGNGETPPTSGTQPSGTGSAPSSTTGSSNTDAENPNLVKATVVDENGNAIEGAYIQICKGETCFPKPIITGANGTGTNDYGELDMSSPLKARIIKIDGFDDFIPSQMDEYVYFDIGSREITITVKQVLVSVVDDEANGINGAVVELYRGDYKFTTQLVTDADGVATGYVAVADGDISAKVVEILSEGEYEISSTPTAFESGSFEGEIIVPKKLVYSVYVTSLFGDGFKDIKVKLFDKKGILQSVATTDENGYVEFEDMQKGEYYVTVTFVNPSYVVVTGDDKGRCYFQGDSTEIYVTVSNLSQIDYVINVDGVSEGAVVKLFNKDNIFIGLAEVVDGKAVIKAPNGSHVAILEAEGVYAAPLYFVYDGVAEGKITATNQTAGLEQSPIVVVNGTELELNADETVYISVPNGYKKGVSVIGDGVVVKYNGKDAELSFFFVEEKGTSSVFAITASKDTKAQVLVFAPGTENEPIDVTDKITSESYKTQELLEDRIYFTYTASKNGVLWVNASFYKVYFGLDGKDKEFLCSDDGKTLYPMTAGENVVIAVDTQGFTPEGKTEIEFGFGELKMDYTAYVFKDGDAVKDVLVELYLGETLVASGKTNDDGKVTFAGLDYSKDYTYKAVAPEGYENALKDDSVGLFTDIVAALTKIKTGEVDAPFDFNTHTDDEKTEEADVKANGTVWFTIYVNPSQSVKYILSATSTNAVITVYDRDTNEDGVIDSNDTPVGVSKIVNGKAVYTFAENGKQYTFAVSTADKNGEKIELFYGSEELEQGASYENSIDVSNGGTFTSTVNGTSYYKFVNDDGCKLTVTLSGQGAKLQRVTLSLDGATATDVDGNVLVIDDTMGEMIYFAVFTEQAQEITITVTAE